MYREGHEFISEQGEYYCVYARDGWHLLVLCYSVKEDTKS